jgi:hypothetical protein
MGDLDRRRAISAFTRVFDATPARHARPFATMAVVCRGPPAKGSPPSRREALNFQSNAGRSLMHGYIL